MSLIPAPERKAPALIRGSRFHIFGPYDEFPLSPDRDHNPPPASVSDCLAMAETLGIQRMVVVQACVFGTNNSERLDAVSQFGQHRARAAAIINDCFADVIWNKSREAATLQRVLADGAAQLHGF